MNDTILLHLLDLYRTWQKDEDAPIIAIICGIESLLKAGADPLLDNPSFTPAKTPLSEAQQLGNKELIEVITFYIQNPVKVE